MLRILAVIVLALSPVAAAAQPEGRIRVIDADTWDVGGVRVRLFGIDAPELDQICTRASGADWACGVWATDRVRALYGGATARCAPVSRDRYGRVVARCSVGGADAGRALVSRGLAFAYRRYSMDYDLDEKGAAVNARGLHAGRVQRPAAFRAARRRAEDGPPAGGCVIKGNISGRGERIYHLPGQRDYARTRLSPDKGERWFCSEAEARAAGWRPARR